MRPTETFDDPELQALLENLPMSKFTPDNLKSRLVDLAASPAPRHRAVRRPVFAIAFAGAATVMAVAMMMSLPATAKSWAGIKKAVQGIRSMEMEIREFDKAKPGVTKVAFAPGTVLVRPPEGEIVYISAGKVQIYDPKENVVREFPMPAEGVPDVANEVLGEISLSKMLSEWERDYGKENIKIGAFRTYQGRRVYDATLNKPATAKDSKEERVNIVADAETDLPIFIEAFNRVNGTYKKTTEIVAHYNGQINAKPNFPSNAKYEKFDIGKIIENAKKGDPPGDNEDPDFDIDL